MKIYIVPKAEGNKFWENVSKLGKVYMPFPLGENFYFSLTPPPKEKEVSLEGYRTIEPIKSFFFPAKAKVSEFGKEIESPREKIVLAGVRACDLHSLKILDYVFKEGDFKDPFYISRRENTFLIASDCTGAKEVCFCTYFRHSPYPIEGYDLAISFTREGMLVESGSENGEGFLKGLRLREASTQQMEERDLRRKEITQLVERQVKENKFPEVKNLCHIVEKGQQNPVWEEKAKVCVECGACNLVCPTCHCFLLSEEKEGDIFSRYQIWDSCQYKLFAQVAGGANPRKYLSERIRNRFNKKFDFFYKILNIYACTGCGRCIEGCLAKIDLREVLKKLEEPVSVSASQS